VPTKGFGPEDCVGRAPGSTLFSTLLDWAPGPCKHTDAPPLSALTASASWTIREAILLVIFEHLGGPLSLSNGPRLSVYDRSRSGTRPARNRRSPRAHNSVSPLSFGWVAPRALFFLVVSRFESSHLYLLAAPVFIQVHLYLQAAPIFTQVLYSIQAAPVFTQVLYCAPTALATVYYLRLHNNKALSYNDRR